MRLASELLESTLYDHPYSALMLISLYPFHLVLSSYVTDETVASVTLHHYTQWTTSTWKYLLPLKSAIFEILRFPVTLCTLHTTQHVIPREQEEAQVGRIVV